MIRKQDFIDALGRPDADFEERVALTLDFVTKSPRQRSVRRIFALAAATAAVLAIFITAVAFMRGTDPSPDVLAAPTATPTPSLQTTPTATPTPSLQTTPPPPTQLPDDWALFEAAYGQEITVLYPWAEFVREETISEDQTCWYLSDFSGEFLACRIMTGRMHESSTDGEHDYISVNAVMPSYATAVEEFMQASPKWLQALYYNEEVVGDRLPLAHIIVTLDESGQPFACEMLLGEYNQHYISWVRDESGEFVQVRSYYDADHHYTDTYFE